MCRSSRYLGILAGGAMVSAGIGLPWLCQAAPLARGPTAMPGPIAVRPSAHPVGAHPVGALGGRVRSFGLHSRRRYADGYLDTPGIALGLETSDSVLAGPPPPPDEPPQGEAPPLGPPPGFMPPQPCIAPQIIQIGRGLSRRVPTRVIYGPPSCGLR